ncbi:hypothetical protein [Mucilaginibacter paludis]|uniref:Uncharacterized protein n=1 Tax=Mucilaginibacter paludis DSM 18603 TaxID=714943 RepID=H1Y6K6_9SPHI|nr:hypothetical protein [Mucilaginibacter paludis]EHQ25850.1 hypothetical protein Mucpa_1695 [Mucilaginibacter paludis DSM 18603]
MKSHELAMKLLEMENVEVLIPVMNILENRLESVEYLLLLEEGNKIEDQKFISLKGNSYREHLKKSYYL